MQVAPPRSRWDDNNIYRFFLRCAPGSLVSSSYDRQLGRSARSDSTYYILAPLQSPKISSDGGWINCNFTHPAAPIINAATASGPVNQPCTSSADARVERDSSSSSRIFLKRKKPATFNSRSELPSSPYAHTVLVCKPPVTDSGTDIETYKFLKEKGKTHTEVRNERTHLDYVNM